MKTPPRYIILESDTEPIYQSFVFDDAFKEWKRLFELGCKVALYRGQLSYTLLASFEGNDGTVKET